MSCEVDETQQGRLQGANYAVMTLAWVIGPLIWWELWVATVSDDDYYYSDETNVDDTSASLFWWVAAMVLMISAAILLGAGTPACCCYKPPNLELTGGALGRSGD